MNRCPRALLVSVLLFLAAAAGAAAAGAAPAAGPADPQQALLGAVGTLAGSDACASYMALGAVADGWVREVYAADKVVRIVGILRRLAEGAAAGLEAVAASGALAEPDRGYLGGMTEAYRALVTEADALVTWVQTGERAAFDAARDKAWKTILATLGPSKEEALE
jgi:hypothetical protein